jgi:hypothetical protein
VKRLLFPTTLSIPSYDIGKYVGLRTYQHPLVLTPSIGYENDDSHTKICTNLSALSKTEKRNAIYRHRGEIMTTFPLTRGKLALREGFY